ncbi:MAG: hypothetical protein ABL927_12065, partial [Bdellovibrionales bacterium]
ILPDAQPELDLIKISDRNIEDIFELYGYRVETGYEFGAIYKKWPTIGHNYLLVQKNSDSSCDYKFLTFTMAEKNAAYKGNYSVSSEYGSLDQITDELKQLKPLFSLSGELWFTKNSLIELGSKKDIIDFLNVK